MSRLPLHLDLFKQTASAWLDDKASRLGAALAFYSVLSLSPLLVLLLTIATAIWGKDAAQGQLLDQIRSITGTQAAAAIQQVLAAGAANKYGGVAAAIIGFASLLFSASGAFTELQDALNTIWRVEPKRGRPFLTALHERFLSFAMVLSCGFLLLISLVISAVLAAVSHYIAQVMPLAVFVMHLVNLALNFSIITVLFALIFKIVPDTAIPWRGVWGGAALTTLLFILGKALIGLYLGRAGIETSYGAAGSIVVLLLWIYYTAQILFFGAEFTHIYTKHVLQKPDEMP